MTKPRRARQAVTPITPEEGNTMSITPQIHYDTEPPLLLNVEEAAHLLSLRPKTVYEYSAAGIIPSVKVGRLRRFRRADLEAWVAQQGTGPAA